MQRFFSPASIAAALIALSASAGAWGAELDFDMPRLPLEPEQLSASAQPQGWTARSSSSAADVANTRTQTNLPRSDDGATPGGAMFMPFAATSQAASVDSAASARVPAPKASRGSDVSDLVLTLVAVLAGVGAVAWLLRSA